MKSKRRRSTLVLVISSIVIGLFLLTAGPVVINYIFITETTKMNLNLAFDAGNLLDYYGAVLGGLVTCFAIISAIHINNQNLKEDRQRVQFERAYEIYHKLPEILARLDSAAIHVQYSVHINESTLMETLDTMKECDGSLREQHMISDKYFDNNIDLLLKNIAGISAKCQDVAESFIIDKEKSSDNEEPPHEKLEESFKELREAIKTAKIAVMEEINKFTSINEGS